MDVICFDKTGTLTKNNVVLSHIYADRFVHTSLDTDSDPLNANWPIFRALSEAVLANNTAKFASDKGSQSGSQISVSRAHFQAEDVKWMGNRMDCAMMEFLDSTSFCRE
jgi:magnesium-transporting ATPase (P-type)